VPTSIGTIEGVFLEPGVSKNGRLYTQDIIADSVSGMAGRLSADKPIAMHARHASASILEQCAGIRKVWTDTDGRGRYEADIPDTRAGRDLLALTTKSSEGRRFLNSVSIYGGWLGPTRTIEHDGQQVVTGDNLLISRVDFTGDPGVDGARMESAGSDAARETLAAIEASGMSFTPVTEAAPPATAMFSDVAVQVTEADAPSMSNRGSGHDGPGGPYADPGYKPDKKQRFQLDTKAHVKSALSLVAMPSNQKGYSASQLASVKSKIKAAAKKFGISTEAAPAPADVHDQLAESVAALEAMVGVSAMQGPAGVDVHAYGVDNADVAAATALVGQAAAAALLVLDPDQDDDLDLPGDDPDDPDGDAVPPVCGACATELPDYALFCPGCGIHVGSTESFSTPDQEVTEMGPTKCGGCKSDVPADAKFCPNCGANTKTKDGGPESAPSGQEGHVAENQGLSESDRKAIVDDLAAQLKATLAPATETVVAAGDGATESAGDTTTAASAATTTEAASATDIAAIIAAEVAKVRDEAAAARETDRTAMIEAFGKTMTAERDTWRKESLETSGGPRRKGLLERVHALSEADDTPLHTLPAHERTKRHQQNIADQLEMAGAHPAFVNSVRTEHSA